MLSLHSLLMRMKQRDLDYIIILLLILGSLYLVTTGLIMDKMGLHHFAFHTQVGYIWVILAFVHLVFNWGRVKAYWRHRFRLHPHQDLPALPKQPQQLEHNQKSDRRIMLFSVLAMAGGFILGRLLPIGQTAKFSSQKTDGGTFYHQWSKLGYPQALRAILNWGEQPARYKTYADAKQIELPDPKNYKGLSLESAIATRRSQRDYLNAPLSLVDLSRLLHLACGITHATGELRAAPSAGALYPLEVYPVVHRVEGLQSGIYHYAVEQHKLELLQPGDFRAQVVTAGLGQNFLGQASVCFVISAIFQRTQWKYHERTYRYVLMEAGHMGQNLYLGATSLGLGACAIGAFLDDALNHLLGLDGQKEAALYLITVGRVETR